MKTLNKIGIISGVAIIGFILGKQYEKRKNINKTVYAGSLNFNTQTKEMFLSLDESPEKLETSANVIFKVVQL